MLSIFPRTMYAEYGMDGRKWVAVWRSWFGKIIWEKRYLIDPEDRNF